MAEEIIKKEDSDESEIDILELVGKLWAQRKKIFKWCGIAVVLALIVGFSIPKEYTTPVMLAPESTDEKQSTSGLSALASMAGISLGGSSSIDAVYPLLYPDLVGSIPFMTSLLDVEVPLSDDEGTMVTVQEYITDYMRAPWWSAVFALPGKAIGALLPKDEEEVDENHKLDNFHLTMDEGNLVDALKGMIEVEVNDQNSVVTINVTTQDPLVSATLADTVVSRLQQYITDYRTSKARNDLEYVTKLNQEAKDNYYAAQQRYADYLDRNQGITLHSAQTTRERLSQETNLAYSLYNTTAQQVQQAQAKVQESTPAYAVLQPATVPLLHSAPSKFKILIAFVFLAFVGCATWILFLQPFLQNNKGMFKKADEEAKAAAAAENDEE